MDAELALLVARELRTRGVWKSESIKVTEWRARNWPESGSFFRLVDAFLRVYKELDAEGWKGELKI